MLLFCYRESTAQSWREVCIINAASNLLLWEPRKSHTRCGHGLPSSLLLSKPPCPGLPKIFHTTATECENNCWQEWACTRPHGDITFIICEVGKNSYPGLRRVRFYLQLCKLWLIIQKGKRLHVKPARQSTENRAGCWGQTRLKCSCHTEKLGSHHVYKLLFQYFLLISLQIPHQCFRFR